MECPICLEKIENKLISSCCKNKFCKNCYYHAIYQTKCCPLCRSIKDSLYIEDEVKDFILFLKLMFEYHYEGNYSEDYIEIKTDIINKFFTKLISNIWLINHDYNAKQLFIKGAINLKSYINWQDWQEFDIICKEVNINITKYILDIIN